MAVKTKICTKCGNECLATAKYFHRDKHTKDGLGTQCKVCRLEVQIEYSKTKKGQEALKRAQEKRKGSKKNKLNWHKHNLKRHYGITLEEYDKLLEKQDGVCAICGGININGRRLYVDHNHRTNKIRKLLCHNCNSLIGYAKENIEILTKVIKYLENN